MKNGTTPKSRSVRRKVRTRRETVTEDSVSGQGTESVVGTNTESDHIPANPTRRQSQSQSQSQSDPQRRHSSGRRWAYAGVCLMSAMSACLNGYANSLHAEIWWAGWLMGLAVPAIVIILARLAGHRWREGERPLAYAGAAVGVGLLALSVWHCAVSISLLTGSHILLALPMAVAVDAGLVYSEVCLTLG